MDKYKVDLNDYDTIKLLGRGAFGDVILVKHKKTGKTYAAKLLRSLGNQAFEVQRELINREIQVMIQIRHPTIVKFHGYSTQDVDGKHVITILTEEAKGGTLSDICYKNSPNRKKFKYDNTSKQIILIGIARGMMILHQNQGIHRDLKPDNVLLDEKLRPQISDFGLSKIMEENDLNQTRIHGDVKYVSPECLVSASYNQKTDVYSFGILMYEVVTETPCFGNNPRELKEMLTKILEGFRPDINGVKPGIEKLIQRCWSHFPRRRPTFEAIFKALAFNKDDDFPFDAFDDADDDVDDADENKYFLDDVDVKKVKSYVDSIYEKEKDAPLTLEAMAERLVKLEKELKNVKYDMRKLARENKMLKDKLNIKKDGHDDKMPEPK